MFQWWKIILSVNLSVPIIRQQHLSFRDFLLFYFYSNPWRHSSRFNLSTDSSCVSVIRSIVSLSNSIITQTLQYIIHYIWLISSALHKQHVVDSWFLVHHTFLIKATQLTFQTQYTKLVQWFYSICPISKFRS